MLSLLPWKVGLVMTLADVSIATNQDFNILLDKVIPRCGDTIEMPLDAPSDSNVPSPPS
ncbi:MAG: hypothetical protein ACREU6_15400 [Steroidobacteraceae bacterium]